MKKPFFRIALAAILAASIGFVSPLAAHASGSPSHGKSSNDSFFVLKITTDKIVYKVIGSSNFSDEKKRTEDDYKQRYKEWQDEKKSDPKAPRPPRPIIKKMPVTFQTQKGAQDYVDKLKEEDDKKDDKSK